MNQSDHNERDVEKIVRDFYDHRLKDQGEVGNIALEPREQRSIKNKKGTSSRPEFILTHPDYSDIVLVVECKTFKKDHAYKEAPAASAIREVGEYKRDLIKENEDDFEKYKFKVTLAISDLGDNQLIDMEIPNRFAGSISVKKMITFEEISEIINKDEVAIAQRSNDLKKGTEVFRKKLRGVLEHSSGEQLPLFVTAVMTALKDKTFRHNFHDNSGVRANNFNKLKQDVLDKVNGKFSNVLNESSLGEKATDGESNLYSLIQDMNLLLFKEDYIQNDQDILGKFYHSFMEGEVSKSAGTAGDNKKQGIVLTPDNIKDLMCSLGGINKDSIVYDPCTGTGGFLITANHHMKKDAKGDIKKIHDIRNKQLLGVEFDDIMYELAKANFGFKEINSHNLHHGSCFDISQSDLSIIPTVGLMNPPYGDDNGSATETETDFILDFLSKLAPGSKGVVIVPKGITYKPKFEKGRKDILKDHTLDVIINLAQGTFPDAKGTDPIIMVFTSGIKHSDNTKTKVIDWEIRNKVVDNSPSDLESIEVLDLIDNMRGVNAYSGNVIIRQDKWLPMYNLPMDVDLLTIDLFRDTIKSRNIFKKSKELHPLIDITDVFFDR